MSEKITIQVSRDTATILHNEKNLGDSYDDVINRWFDELKALRREFVR